MQPVKRLFIFQKEGKMMENRFILAMFMAFVTLLLCASKKTAPVAIITGAISVYMCCSMVPELMAAAG